MIIITGVGDGVWAPESELSESGRLRRRRGDLNRGRGQWEVRAGIMGEGYFARFPPGAYNLGGGVGLRVFFSGGF